MTQIYIDIETCPAQDPAVRAEIASGITHPGNISKPETIAAWHTEKKPSIVEEAWRKTALDGAHGHLCVLGVAFDDEPPVTLFDPAWKENEAGMLMDFFSLIDDKVAQRPNVRPIFIGHNILDFDLRFLFQRAVMLGVKPSRHIPFSARYYDDSVYDTMKQWAGPRDYVKLDKLAKVMGIQCKADDIGEPIDGSKVWDFVKAGRIEDVAKYCAGDIVRTRRIHGRMTFAHYPE